MPDLILNEALLVPAVPVLIGLLVVRLGSSRPQLADRPLKTALVLSILLVIAVTLSAPDGDLRNAAIGGLVSACVSAAVFGTLWRRARARSV